MRFSSVYAAAVAATVASALPDVKTVLLGAQCHNYPGYNATTGEAGPWALYASSTDEPLGAGTGASVGDVDPSVEAKFQFAMNSGPGIAVIAVKCGPSASDPFPDGQGGLQAWLSEWLRVTHGASNDKDFMLAGQKRGQGGRSAALQAHAHFLDGSKQEGVFLGYGGFTTWAYKRQVQSDGQDMYRLRLMLNDKMEEGEFKGFVRAGGY